ncbi:hypothetical protein BGZ72_010509 [Mortierella alpina]|nr:hypothetical protein BGZ72_010509 [Mortierella alpina]
MIPLSRPPGPVRSPIPTLHALGLVEIRSLIAQFLTKKDLAVCILVSKQWATDFLPLYWHSVSISPHRLARCHEAALLKHGQHVRILSAGRIEDTSVFNQPCVAHLTKLDVSTCGSKDREDGGRGCLHEIIHRNRDSLRTLCWRCYGRHTHLGNRAFRLWAAMFQDLGNLTTIELWNWAVSRVDFLRMLVACPELRNLKLDAVEAVVESGALISHSRQESVLLDEDSGHNTTGSNTQQPHHEKSSLFEFKHGKLETLEFVGNVLSSMLQHVPNLTHLSMLHLLHGDFKDLHESVQRGDSCQRITHLTMLTTCSAPAKFLTFIETIPAPGVLVSFEGLVPLLIVDEFLEAILQRHAGTIENLVLRDENSSLQFQQPQNLGGVFRFNIWELLERCPNLVTLEIPYSLQNCASFRPAFTPAAQEAAISGSTSSLSMEATPFISSANLILKPYEPTREWVCKDLKRLMLRIKDMDEAKPMDQITFDLCVDRLLPPDEQRDNTKRTRSALERMILERLSGLEKLEKLHIGGGWYDLPKRIF